MENWNENEVEEMERPQRRKKRAKRFDFFSFFIGTLACALCIAVFSVVYVKNTGNFLLLGDGKISKVDGDVVRNVSEIYTLMNIYYYDDIDEDAVKESIYRSLLDSLDDPYSVYYTKKEYEDFKVSTSGTYSGIGAGVSQNLDTMEVTITKVYKGTPAEEAGLKNGDKILSVEGVEAVSVEVDELVQYIRGEEGTTVRMVIYRPSTEETLEFDVERRNVELLSVEGEMLENGIAYIQILEFQSKTDEQFQEMVESFKEQGMKGLIIDVRSNPGGILDSVVNLLDYILPEGLIVYVEDKYGNRDEFTSGEECIELPIVVLADENSASASEIFAGALKDYDYATIVGKTTFGKGIVQKIMLLSNGDAMKLTTEKYFTPNGNYIHGVGIEPHIEVEFEYTGAEDADYDKQYDSQFVKALEVMKEMLK